MWGGGGARPFLTLEQEKGPTHRAGQEFQGQTGLASEQQLLSYILGTKEEPSSPFPPVLPSQMAMFQITAPGPCKL